MLYKSRILILFSLCSKFQILMLFSLYENIESAMSHDECIFISEIESDGSNSVRKEYFDSKMDISKDQNKNISGDKSDCKIEIDNLKAGEKNFSDSKFECKIEIDSQSTHSKINIKKGIINQDEDRIRELRNSIGFMSIRRVFDRRHRARNWLEFP